MYAFDGITKTRNLQRLLFYSWLAKDLLPHHRLQNVNVLTRCLPMGTLALPRYTHSLPESFLSNGFVEKREISCRNLVYNFPGSEYAVCQCGNWRSQEWISRTFRIPQGIICSWLSEDILRNREAHNILKAHALQSQQHKLLQKNNGRCREVAQMHTDKHW